MINRITLLLLFIGFAFSQENAFIGEKASPVILFKLDQNKYFKSKDLLGEKNLVFSFFATWCLPCAKEIPKGVIVNADISINVSEVLIPRTGSLTVLSEPIGAIVFINDVAKGKTPHDIPGLTHLKCFQTI